MTTNNSIKLATDALRDAQTAYREGRLVDCRRALTQASWEAESGAWALNAAIAVLTPPVESGIQSYKAAQQRANVLGQADLHGDRHEEA